MPLYDVVHLKRSDAADRYKLAIDHVGFVKHVPGATTLTDIRSNHILHYVKSGKGVFACDGEEYMLRAGDVYLFPKNTKVAYHADRQSPWCLYYVGFYGDLDNTFTSLLGLSQEKIVLHGAYSDKLDFYFTQMLQSAHEEDASMTTLVGWFYLIIGELLHSCALSNDAIESLDLFHSVSNYIQSNLSRALRIADIANTFHISQSQLYRIFRDACGLSPQQYYEKMRINYACTLIFQSTLTYKEIAQLCGYEYESHFYKAFEKLMGTTPAHYRQQRHLYKNNEA